MPYNPQEDYEEINRERDHLLEGRDKLREEWDKFRTEIESIKKEYRLFPREIDLGIFYDILDNITEGVCYINPKGEINWFNKSVNDSLGYQPEEILKKHYTEFVSPEERALAEEIFREVLETQKPRETLLTYVKKNGEKLYGETRITPIKERDGSVGIVAIIRDKTPLIRSANELTRNLFYHVMHTHYLRNDLAAIMGFAEVLEDHVDQIPPGRARDLVERIVQEIKNRGGEIARVVSFADGLWESTEIVIKEIYHGGVAYPNISYMDQLIQFLTGSPRPEDIELILRRKEKYWDKKARE